MTKYFGLSNLKDGITIEVEKTAGGVGFIYLFVYYFVEKSSILDVLRCLFWTQLEMSNRLLGIQVWGSG